MTVAELTVVEREKRLAEIERAVRVSETPWRCVVGGSDQYCLR